MKALIFDFDGVVIDSETYWPAVSTAMYTTLFGAWTAEDQKKLLGKSFDGVYSLLKADYNLDMTYDMLKELIIQNARAIYGTHATIIPGIPSLLDRLAALGTDIAIASSNERMFIDEGLERLRISHHFPHISSANDAPERGKPHPDLYLIAASRIKREPADCVAIEDSMNGVLSAKAAGMHCIAFHCAHNETQDLSAADTHIDSFDELTTKRLEELLA